MKVLDVGSAMGYFSLPMAQLVGDSGNVIYVDLQEKMLSNLKRRVAKANLQNRIETRLSASTSLQINNVKEQIDFAPAFAVVHEVHVYKRFLSEIYNSLKKYSYLLIAEPKGHVRVSDFNNTIETALSIGF